MFDNSILNFLLNVVSYGGGAGAVGYAMFQLLGKNWIENKFAKALEEHKHEQVLEIERLRLKIDALLSGAIKIQEKEFETLPEAWCKLDDAFGNVSKLVSPLQSYPDLNPRTPAQLEEFLAVTELFETEKDEIRQSKDKGKKYDEIIFFHRLHAVKKSCADLHNYVARCCIFFPPELKAKFERISEELWSAVSLKEIGKQAQDYKMQREGWGKIKDEIEPLYKTIGVDIHNRLRWHGRSK